MTSSGIFAAALHLAGASPGGAVTAAAAAEGEASGSESSATYGGMADRAKGSSMEAAGTGDEPQQEDAEGLAPAGLVSSRALLEEAAARMTPAKAQVGTLGPGRTNVWPRQEAGVRGPGLAQVWTGVQDPY